MKMFVLNLARRMDRWTAFQANWNPKWGPLPIRVEAPEGVRSPLPDRLDPNTHTPTGGFGCSYGHQICWGHALALTRSPFVVFEDDCLLRDGWIEATEEALRGMPPVWSLLNLGPDWTFRKVKPTKVGSVYRTHHVYRTHAAVYNPYALTYLSQLIWNSGLVIDCAFAHAMIAGDPSFYTTREAWAGTTGGKSDLEDKVWPDCWKPWECPDHRELTEQADRDAEQEKA